MDLFKLIKKDNSDIYEVSLKRHSERYYQSKDKLNKEAKLKLEEYAKTLTEGGVYSTKILIEKTDQKMNTDDWINPCGDKETDYPWFFIGAILTNIKDSENHGLIDFGYVFEKLVLYAAHLGIGTCWVGGTYHAEEAEKLFLFKDITHQIIAISPYGKIREKKDLSKTEEEKMQWVDDLVKPRTRIPLEDIFFINDFKTPMDIYKKKNVPANLKKIFKFDENEKSESPSKKENKLEKFLECVRWSPSAVNSQGWRIIYDEKNNQFIFFVDSERHFYKFQDIGIAMVHFEIAAYEYGLPGYWDSKNVNKYSTDYFVKNGWKLPSEVTDYAATWLIDGKRP